MILMKTMAERIIEARKIRGLTQEILAESAGIKQQSLHVIEKGITKKPRKLKKIAHALGVTPEWLEYGSGSAPWEKSPTDPGEIPVLSWNQAKNNCLEDRKIYTDFEEIISLTNPGIYALKVTGHNMISHTEPRKSFYPGQFILVDHEKNPRNGDFVIAITKDKKEIVFKQYLIDGDEIFLVSLSHIGKPIPLSEIEKICGVVIKKLEDVCSEA